MFGDSEEPVGRLIQNRRREQGLTQEQLARQADVPYTTLTKVESGAIKNPSVQFVWKVSRALQISIDTLLVPQLFHGENSVRRIWQDILETLTEPGGEMHISGIDEGQFLIADREVLRFIEDIKERGLKQKLLCAEGDKSFLEGDHLEYRAIPKEHFNPTPMYVYADKVAFLLWGPPQQAMIIENRFIADALRKQFLLIWQAATPVRRRSRKKARLKPGRR